MNIVVPLAGKEEPFIDAFGDLKPFAPVNGRPLIEAALECLPFPLDKVHFICLRAHEKRFNVGERLKNIFGAGVNIVWAESLTEGSACSALLAAQNLDPDEDLLITLADVLFDPLSLKREIEEKGKRSDGIIPVCPDTRVNRRWGYVYYVNGEERVGELKEKELEPTSLEATLGLYYFTRNRDFVSYTSRMIQENQREPFTNLFYVGPVYNLLVEDGLNIETAHVKILANLGSVDDIQKLNSGAIY